MQEEEFKKLLEKYLNGTLSEDEQKILDAFENGLKSKDKQVGFHNRFEKVQVEESIWSGIDMESAKTPRRLPWKSIASVAAIFVGLFALGFFYMQTFGDPLTNIPENVITLELEDGTIKVMEDNGTTRVVDKNGNVIGQQHGNQLVYALENGSEELAYNTLTVPYGKTFELELSDGTKAYLNAGSSIKYPIKFIEGHQRQVFVVGEAYLEVAKDSLHPFIASSEGLNVQVLGTQFNFSAYPEDDFTEVVLVEGSVSLFTEANGFDVDKNTILEPGVKGSLNRANQEVSTQEVITSIYTSWMQGKLVFRNMTFKNILKKLERHYNVTIVNNNVELSNKVFNANFGQQPLGNVLQELDQNYGVKYVVSGDTIIIE